MSEEQIINYILAFLLGACVYSMFIEIRELKRRGDPHRRTRDKK